MKVVTAAAAVLLAFCGIAQAADQISDRELAMAAMNSNSLSQAQANELEDGLKKNPNDFLARAKLLGYYFSNPGDAANKSQSAAHALWVVKNHPDNKFASSPFVQIDQRLDYEDFSKEKALWQEAIQAHPDNAMVLSNAATFFKRSDLHLAEDLLKKAIASDAHAPQWHDKLGSLYQLQSQKNPAVARQALSEFEAAQSLDADKMGQYYRLDNLAKTAYDSGNMEKAAHYANLLLETAPAYPEDWNYGNAIHHGNIILGRIALKKGDAALAKTYLIKAGNAPASPQLSNFGPNTSLARDLLVAGDKETPLQYLELCRKFWTTGDRQLDDWEVAIKDGKVPEFGQSLVN